MGKLHLKETPEERAERKWRKARRAERKRAKAKFSPHQPPASGDAYGGQEPARKRRRDDEDGGEGGGRGWDTDAEEGWLPPESSTKIDPEALRAQVEERLFREKLLDAMEDDYGYEQRLDGVEARLNDFVHVPRRWKGGAGAGADAGEPSAKPNEMEDEEYAEWVREGMWRRTHKAELEERERKKAARKARKEQERQAKEETARLEREREAERKARREMKERRRLREAWDYYEARWKAFAATNTHTEPPAERLLKFRDVPWPVFSVPTATEGLTTERISAFLLHDLQDDAKARRERIREALLRWHPDKFQGRMGSRLDDREREIILEGVGIVARCLNDMMAA